MMKRLRASASWTMTATWSCGAMPPSLRRESAVPKAKPASLLDDVLARVKAKRPGFMPWHERLPDDLQAELAAIRERFHAGGIASQKRALAVAIAEVVAERGHTKPGEQAVISWLNRKA
jgi:hypothetical protein